MIDSKFIFRGNSATATVMLKRIPAINISILNLIQVRAIQFSYTNEVGDILYTLLSIYYYNNPTAYSWIALI